MVEPATRWTVRRLLEHLDTAPAYLAVTGPIGAGKTALAGHVAERCGGRPVFDGENDRILESFYRHPAGQASDAQLQFLHKRARLLDPDELFAETTRSESSGPVVSDFWFDQTLAYADLWLSDAALPSYHRAHERARQHVLRPKLLVLLEISGESLTQRITRRGWPYPWFPSPDWLEQLGERLRHYAQRPNQGPVLRLSATDPDEMAREAVAAVAAMR